MSLNVKTSTGLQRIHSVRVKGEGLPVTFLKSIKSVGNSIINIDDAQPEYNWTLIATIKIGSLIPDKNHNNTLFGIRNDVSNNCVGSYAVSFNGDNGYMAFYLGTTWSDTGFANFSINSGDYNSVFPLTSRFDGKYCAFNGNTSTPSATPTRTNLGYGFAISGRIFHQNGVMSLEPCTSNELTVYDVQIFTSAGTKIYDLVPAQSKATGRGGMYDTISKKFYPADSNFDDFVKEAIT